MGTIVLNYDVEVYDRSRAHITRDFLAAAEKVHRETGAQCGLFVCGKTLELHEDAFRRLSGNGLFDFQSHTYAHSALKSSVRWEAGRAAGDPNAGRVEVVRGASLNQVRAEVGKTSQLLDEVLGVENIGLACPMGCYLGLLDRPELIETLWGLGIRYVHGYYHQRKPAPLDAEDIISPFWYSAVGQSRGYILPEGEPSVADALPEILEFPLGVADTLWKEMYGYDANEEYVNAVKATIDVVAREDLVMRYTQHDWSTVRNDPTMQHTRAIIDYAQRKGVELVSSTEYYHRALRQKRQVAGLAPSSFEKPA